MSIWFLVIGSLAVGIVIGITFTRRLGTDAIRVQQLEEKLESMSESHMEYRNNVSEHFNMTSELINQMTDSYKKVYGHLAIGAQDLCSDQVAEKLLPLQPDAMFEDETVSSNQNQIEAPKDYATKSNPNQVGALSEDFGLKNTKANRNKNNP
ncbi:MAG: hypothetical protein CMQ26_00985 [Gammaproteobacteria bacterium]|mgnify:FL=1|nr:hypothetical protein [Gammaproteobacteria bacterium]